MCADIKPLTWRNSWRSSPSSICGLSSEDPVLHRSTVQLSRSQSILSSVPRHCKIAQTTPEVYAPMF